MVKLGHVGTLAGLYEAIGIGLASFAWPTFINTLAPPITSDEPFAQVAMSMQKNHRRV